MSNKWIAGCTMVILLTLCGSSTAQQRPDFEVIAYYSGNGKDIERYPAQHLTQIIYSFLHLKGDTLGFSSPEKAEGLKRVVALKQRYPGLKVLVSLGGWGGCETCSPVFAKPESRQRFSAALARLLDQYDADGIDLDWEYPTIPGYPGHAYMPEDKNNFTELVREIRKAIGPRRELSFAAGGFTRFLEESVDWKALEPLVDRVNLMTYDLVSGFSTVTGHHTPLRGNADQKESTDHCVQWLLQHGFPAKKLVVGAAFYARVWEDVAPARNGLYQQGKFKSYVSNREGQRLSADSGWVHQWDPVAEAPFAYHPLRKEFATFDNAESLKRKVAYARRYGLGGIMFWELNNDRYEQGLLEAIGRAVAEKQ